MKTLDELFSRYGHPAEEMNERINLYFIRADKLDTMERIRQYDHSAEEDINRLTAIKPTSKIFFYFLSDFHQIISS